MSDEELKQEQLKELRLRDMSHQLMIRLLSLMNPGTQEADDLS